MKLEDQVCSVELSQKLKELGLVRTSYFLHEQFNAKEMGEYIPVRTKDWPRICILEDALRSNYWDSFWENPSYTRLHAYTASELMGMLPAIVLDYNLVIYKMRSSDFIEKYKNFEWIIRYEAPHRLYDDIDILNDQIEKNIANGLAKQLIWLIEKGHVSVEEINK